MAFSELEKAQLTALRPQIFDMCKKLNARDPENLCQDTLLKAWENQDKFKPGTNLRAWVLMIARNTVFTQYRRNRWEVDTGDKGLHDYLLNTSVSGGQHESLVLKEVFNRLAEMSSEKREMILNHLDGDTYKEIADKAGVVLGTAKSRVSRSYTEWMDRIAALELEPSRINGPS